MRSARPPATLSCGGFSAGGLLASQIALRHSDVFGNVLSHRAPFVPDRWVARNPPPSRECIWMRRDGGALYLETGLYENVRGAGLRCMRSALDEGITASNRHFRDVLIAKD